MASHRLTEEKRQELREFALGYGKILAREAYGPEGLEEIAVEVQQALLKGGGRNRCG